MKLNKFSFQKIKLYIKKFENAENKVEACFYLKEILNLLDSFSTGDERLQAFLTKVQKELKFDLFTTNWKKIELPFPEMNCTHSLHEYLFIKDELEEKKILGETAWTRLQKNITATFDRYEVMFGQMVPLHVI